MGYERAVQRTPELDRILKLPTRTSSTAELVDALSSFLRKKGHVCRPKRANDPTDKGCADGLVRFNEFQTQVLVEAPEANGAFVVGPMGIGKTGVSIMVSRMFQQVRRVERPLLVIPGSEVVREKTMYDIGKMKEHWDVPQFFIESYERLRMTDYAEFLLDMKIDLLILDECQAASDMSRAMANRIRRLKEERPDTPVVAMSGTPSKRSCLDFFHVIVWCLQQNSPVPIPQSEQREWAEYLDGSDEISAGCLKTFGGPSLADVRRGLAKKIFSTPGCISWQGPSVTVPLTVHARYVPLSAEEDHWFRVLVGDPNHEAEYPGWTTPDEHTFTDAAEMWARQQQMSLGFFYRWVPSPPPEWKAARGAWHAAVRKVIDSRDRFDTVAQVSNAVDDGDLPQLEPLLARWRELKPIFEECKTWGCRAKHVEVRDGVEYVKYHNVPKWIGDTSLRYAAKWLQGGGVVWTVHRAFGLRLSEVTGVPFFSEGGMSQEGESLNTTQAPAIIASVQACGTGLNLQRYSRQLIASVWPTNRQVEQAIARLHRQGQHTAVTCDWMISSLGQLRSYRKAKEGDAVFHRDMLTTPARLCYGEVIEDAFPVDTYPVSLWAWRDYGERED